jgi:hypothetical protein
VVGRDLKKPGVWANLILNVNSVAARKGNNITSLIVRELLLHAPLREPQLRETRPMTGQALQAHLNQSKQNIEAALMIVVGTVMQTIGDECTHCLELHGIWARCVIIPGAAGKGLGCANCHQLGRGAKCEKYVPRDEQDEATNRRRGRALPGASRGRRNVDSEIEEDNTRQLEVVWRARVSAQFETIQVLSNEVRAMRETVTRVVRNYQCRQLRDRDIWALEDAATALVRAEENHSRSTYQHVSRARCGQRVVHSPFLALREVPRVHRPAYIMAIARFQQVQFYHSEKARNVYASMALMNARATYGGLDHSRITVILNKIYLENRSVKFNLNINLQQRM